MVRADVSEDSFVSVSRAGKPHFRKLVRIGSIDNVIAQRTGGCGKLSKSYDFNM